MTVLRFSDYKRMPWKNGGGETLEIAVYPPDASTGDFDWRISMASVASDGPFSRFPGINRILTVIDGDAMELSVDGQPPVLLDQGAEPHGFPGDAPTSGRLLNGPISDLNVMVRRGIAHSVTRLEASGLTGSGAAAPVLFIVALQAVAFSCASERITLQRHDTMDLSGAKVADIVVETSGTVLLIAIG